MQKVGTRLFIVPFFGHVSEVKTIVANHEGFMEVYTKGGTPLFIASLYGHLVVVKHLLDM